MAESLQWAKKSRIRSHGNVIADLRSRLIRALRVVETYHPIAGVLQRCIGSKTDRKATVTTEGMVRHIVRLVTYELSPNSSIFLHNQMISTSSASQ